MMGLCLYNLLVLEAEWMWVRCHCFLYATSHQSLTYNHNATIKTNMSATKIRAAADNEIVHRAIIYVHACNTNRNFNSNLSVLFTLEFKYESASEWKWQTVIVLTCYNSLPSVLISLLGMKMIISRVSARLGFACWILVFFLPLLQDLMHSHNCCYNMY